MLTKILRNLLKNNPHRENTSAINAPVLDGIGNLINSHSLLQYFLNNSDRLIHKWVDYFEVYEKHLAKYRGKQVKLLEIGIQNGGSAKMWQYYLGSNAKIIGVDIDPACKTLAKEGFEIHIGDQSKKAFWEEFKKHHSSIDIVIDDGGHTMDQQITTFEEVFPILSNDGVYICEDTHTSYFPAHGGGLGNIKTFHNYIKQLIDEMHGWYHEPLSSISNNFFAKNLYSIDIHDSIIALEKRKKNPPLILARGEKGHVELPIAMSHLEMRRAFGVSDEKSTYQTPTRAPQKSPADIFTKRLMAHDVTENPPYVALASIPARDNNNRIQIAERLLAAYHKAVADELNMPLKREKEDLWSGLMRRELPELIDSINNSDPVALSTILMNFGKSYVWFGGITTCVDGYNRTTEPGSVALSYFDKLVCLAESLGVLRMECPESGPWGENLYEDPGRIVGLIEQKLGIDISPPLGIIHTDGLATSSGTFHYRHLNALYSAVRLSRINVAGGPVCEFGGGLGLTALYCHRLGIRDYTILDLPITCLLAGHYLLHAIGQDQVCLYGESRSASTCINLLPYWYCTSLQESHFAVAFNQDSFPEIDDNLVYSFLSSIKRVRPKSFLSINHECFFPRTVNNFIRKSGGFREIYRSKCWVREGYLEELYEIL